MHICMIFSRFFYAAAAPAADKIVKVAKSAFTVKQSHHGIFLIHTYVCICGRSATFEDFFFFFPFLSFPGMMWAYFNYLHELQAKG